MTPSKSVSAFEEFVEGHGRSLLDLTVRTGIAEMLLFYQTVSPTSCTNEIGDMLLFQWGTYDWGNGKSFEINVTRQFIELDAEDGDAISQLQLTFKFPPDAHTNELGSGNRWCNLQSEIDEGVHLVELGISRCGGFGSTRRFAAPRVRVVFFANGSASASMRLC